MPWMAKSTVHAVLNSDLPFKKPAPPDPAEDEEDPMILMKKQKKLKKVGWLLRAMLVEGLWGKHVDDAGSFGIYFEILTANLACGCDCAPQMSKKSHITLD